MEPLIRRLRNNQAAFRVHATSVACVFQPVITATEVVCTRLRRWFCLFGAPWLIAASVAAQIAPGNLFDVGGYRVHLYCAGTGTPAVILIGGFSFDWALVQPEVARFTRVCTYDASGNAWSDPGPEPTCVGRVDEIHRLLSSAKIDGPTWCSRACRRERFSRACMRDPIRRKSLHWY